MPDPEDWDLHPLDPAEVEKLAWRETRSPSGESIIAHFDWQDREQRILSDRLARRFDLGMALNESAVRAIKEKNAIVPPGYPTPFQLKALEIQGDMLTEVIRRS